MNADHFLNERRDWLSVHCVEVEPGAFDIVLKIDGTYFDRDTAMAVTEAFARDISRRAGSILSVPSYPQGAKS